MRISSRVGGNRTSMDYLIYIKTLLMQGFTSLHKQAQVSNHMKMDPAVPLVYGTIVPDSYNVPSSAPIAVEAAPTSRMDLRTATAMNGVGAPGCFFPIPTMRSLY